MDMPRRRDSNAARVVHRTARVGLRLTRAQRERCFGLLRSAGDVWACVLELNGWRYRRGDRPAAGYQQLCRLLAESGPGTFGELDSTGARSVLRRYSDAWFAAAKRRKAGELEVRYPRRRRALMPIRWYHGTFTLDQRRLRLPTAAGSPALWLRLDRSAPYPAQTIRSVLVRVNAARREDLVGTALAVHAEEADADGWLRLEVTFQDPRHAEWALWQLATKAEVLAPQWLRTALRNRAAAIASCYELSSDLSGSGSESR
jgi:hypothetical protein